MDDSSTSYAFILENTGGKDIVTTEFPQNRNNLTITFPGGDSVEVGPWVKLAEGAKLPVVAPGQRRVWKYDVAGALKGREETIVPGIYKIEWSFERTSSTVAYLFEEGDEEEGGEEQGAGETDGVAPRLMIAKCVDYSGTSYALLLENDGNDDVTTAEFPSNHNNLTITLPNGKSIEVSARRGEAQGAENVVTPPGQTRVWKLDVAEVLKDHAQVIAPGMYKVEWSVEGIGSTTVDLLKEADEDEGGETAGDEKIDYYALDAEKVRRVLPGVAELPRSKAGQVYDLSKLSLERVVEGTGYHLRFIGGDPFGRIGVNSFVFMAPDDEAKHPEVLITLHAGHGSPGDALVMILADMATAASVEMTPSTYERIAKGPGEVCLTWTAEAGAHLGSLWFYRGSVAVSVCCADETVDLLPIGQAIDEALKECPVIGVEQLKKELPDLTAAEPVRVGEPKDRTYRIDFTLSAPLAEHQRVVAVSSSPRASATVNDDHVVVKLREGRKPPEIWVGVYDSKKLWVKWHDESGAAYGDGQEQ